ncbi:MAG: type IV secretion protein DotG [Rhodospirillales bacterium]|nr:type IV secretion protein DotG [Rhodospirillales bacterium]MCB9996960.1 type IV secretion protein DotG [Rhodospirillales bacterium]
MSNNDDFQDDHIDFNDDGGDGEFEDFAGGGTSLGDMWRNNPLVKIGVIAGGLITVIGAIILFGGSEDPTLTSVVRGGGEVSAPPGGEISESYKQAIEQENEERLDLAVREGGSAMPTPIGPPVERLNLPEEDLNADDPLERWRRIQEERQRQTIQQKKPVPTVDPYADAITALANAMSVQMEGILESKTPLKPVHLKVTAADYLEQQREVAREKAKEAAEEAAANAAANNEEVVDILIPAGTIAYAQLITEADSDTKGPIMAQLATGPFAGSRMLGSFEVKEENLVLNFETIVIDGIGHSTTAIAMNPDTTSIGMVTDIDHRYMTRVIWPAAAAFVQGIGEAIGTTNSTTVTVDGGAAVSDQQELDTQEELAKGVEAAAEKISEILDEQADNTEPLIRVEAGTPMGILFLEPVTEE